MFNHIVFYKKNSIWMCGDDINVILVFTVMVEYLMDWITKYGVSCIIVSIMHILLIQYFSILFLV